MILKPMQKVYEFNKQAGLLEAGYSDERECAFPIEEALEGFDLSSVGEIVKLINITPKLVSRAIIKKALESSPTNPIKDVDRFDKHLDILVFTLGSMFKLGLDVTQVMKGLDIVANANMHKLTVGKDEEGKQLKPEDFVSPEPLLQLILDERKVN